MDEMRIKQNKKPKIDVFAKLLELTPKQRASAEFAIVQGQREIHGILDMPTADGSNLKDELVEIVAKGFAQPGKDHGWGRWIGRVMGEKIPGTNETYGTRIEGREEPDARDLPEGVVGGAVPRVQGVGRRPDRGPERPRQPHAALWKAIVERARELGANIPENPDDK